jgi:nicotinamidase-related amidase
VASGAAGSAAGTALLLMDFQQGVVDRIGVGGGGVVEAAAKALKAARAAGVHVFFVRVAFRPGFPEVSARNQTFTAVAARGGSMTETDAGTQITAALAPRGDEPVVTKRRVSAFSGSDLDVLLRSAGVDLLVLAGISTSGVVLSTVRQAADLDFELVVLEDACADPDESVHEMLLERVFPRQATMESVDAWVAGLDDGDDGADEFVLV